MGLRDKLTTYATPERLLEWFIASNLAFLGADIVIAHAVNAFRRSEEWIPIFFSIAAALICLPGLFSERAARAMRKPTLAVGAIAILVGSAGMIYHLQSSFFAERTLRSLVYAAPFIAPLSYVGVGLLLVLARLERPGSSEYAEWILLLALGGFIGNFGLSLSDHAQNGFFAHAEWIAVIASAFAVSFLGMTLVRRDDRFLLRITYGVMIAEVVVAVLGFVLHNRANLDRAAASLVDRMIFGAPVFAPLLLADLAALAGIGFLARARRAARAGASSHPAPPY